jgi:hypothetical protein
MRRRLSQSAVAVRLEVIPTRAISSAPTPLALPLPESPVPTCGPTPSSSSGSSGFSAWATHGFSGWGYGHPGGACQARAQVPQRLIHRPQRDPSAFVGTRPHSSGGVKSRWCCWQSCSALLSVPGRIAASDSRRKASLAHDISLVRRPPNSVEVNLEVGFGADARTRTADLLFTKQPALSAVLLNRDPRRNPSSYQLLEPK